MNILKVDLLYFFCACNMLFSGCLARRWRVVMSTFLRHRSQALDSTKHHVRLFCTLLNDVMTFRSLTLTFVSLLQTEVQPSTTSHLVSLPSCTNLRLHTLMTSSAASLTTTFLLPSRCCVLNATASLVTSHCVLACRVS